MASLPRQFNTNCDYYAILQVHPRAHPEVIKRAYRALQGISHPDLGGNHDEAVMLNEAYRVLSDSETRKAYDEARRTYRPSKPHPGAARDAAMHEESAPPQPRPTPAAPTRPKPAPHVSPANLLIYCPRCGSRNRLPRAARLEQAICGKCRTSLATGRVHATNHGTFPVEIRLSSQLQEQLVAFSELRVSRPQLTPDRHAHCNRCHHEWKMSPSDGLPKACPKCQSTRWSLMRIFRCRHCGHQFISSVLSVWPYWLFSECPSCRTPHWHIGCEKHPLRWVINQLNVIGR